MSDTQKPVTIPHGMRVKVFDEKQNAVILCFASVAKHKPLRTIIKKIDDTEWELGCVVRKSKALAMEAEGLRGDFTSEDEKKNASARKKLQSLIEEGAEVSRKADELEDRREDEIAEFYMSSMKAAGYTEEQALENMSLLKSEQYHEIRAIVRTGCGYLDFTQEAAA